jgi:hypothetical protein
LTLEDVLTRARLTEDRRGRGQAKIATVRLVEHE